MTLFDSTAYKVSEETFRYAKKIAKGFKTEFSRKRIYEALICMRTLAEYFESEGFIVDNQSTLHQIIPINEELECNDLRCNGRCIDVRTVVNGKYILIPKAYYKYNVLPDLYAVAKYNSDTKTVNILGCIEPLEIDKQRQNEKYFIMDTAQLIQPFQIEDRVKLIKNTKISDQNHEMYASYCIDYYDGVLSEENKKELFKHLFECKGCRDRFANFYNYETVVKNSSEYPEILQDKMLNIVGATDVNNDKYKNFPEVTIEVEKEPDKYAEDEEENEEEKQHSEDPLQVLYGKKQLNIDVFNSFKQKPMIDKKPKSMLDSVMADMPKIPTDNISIEPSVVNNVSNPEIKEKNIGKINPELYNEDFSDGIDVSEEKEQIERVHITEPENIIKIEDEPVSAKEFDYIEDIVAPEPDPSIYNQEEDEPMFINELKPQTDETSAFDEMLLLDKPVSPDFPQFANYKPSVLNTENTGEDDIIIINDDQEDDLVNVPPQNTLEQSTIVQPETISKLDTESDITIQKQNIIENKEEISVIPDKVEDTKDSDLEKYEDVSESDLIHFNVENIDITDEYENKYVVKDNANPEENVKSVILNDNSHSAESTTNNILPSIDDENTIEIIDENDNENDLLQIQSDDEGEIEVIDEPENTEELIQINPDSENEEDILQLQSDIEDARFVDNENQEDEESQFIDIPRLDFEIEGSKPVNIDLPEISADIGDHNPLYETVSSANSDSLSETDIAPNDNLSTDDLLNSDLANISDIDLSLNFDDNFLLDNNQSSVISENDLLPDLKQETTKNKNEMYPQQIPQESYIDMSLTNNADEMSHIEENKEEDDDDIILIDDKNKPIMNNFNSKSNIPFEQVNKNYLNNDDDDDIILIDDDEETNSATFFRPASVSDLNTRFMETEDIESEKQGEIDEIDDDITFVNQEEEDNTSETQFIRPAGAAFEEDSLENKIEIEKTDFKEIDTSEPEIHESEEVIIENYNEQEITNNHLNSVKQTQKAVRYDEDGFEIEDDETDENQVSVLTEQDSEQPSVEDADESFDDDSEENDEETEEVDDTEEFADESEEDTEEEVTTDNRNNLIKKVAIIGLISLVGLGGVGGGLFYYLNKAKQEKMKSIEALNALNEDTGVVDNNELNQGEGLNLDEGEGIQLPEEGENKELAEQMPPQEKPVAENGEEQLPPPPSTAPENKKPQPETPKAKDMNQAMTNAFSDNPSVLKVTKTAWAVAPYIAADTEFKAFLQTSGRAIQASIKKNLQSVKDNTYSENTKVQILFSDGQIGDITISKSSGSKQIDDIVLQSVKDYMGNAQLPKLSETSVQAIKNANGNNSFKITFSVNF